MIDEKKLIEEIEKIDLHGRMREYAGLCAAVDIIKNQPQVSEWIPCSERLPELHRVDMESEGEYYMISDSVIITDGEMVSISEYEIDDGDCRGWFAHDFEEIEDVIAWMPIPEPYNPGMIRKQTNADRIRAMTDEI